VSLRRLTFSTQANRRFVTPTVATLVQKHKSQRSIWKTNHPTPAKRHSVATTMVRTSTCKPYSSQEKRRKTPLDSADTTHSVATLTKNPNWRTQKHLENIPHDSRGATPSVSTPITKIKLKNKKQWKKIKHGSCKTTPFVALRTHSSKLSQERHWENIPHDSRIRSQAS
jgi:hypothetical protein